MDPIRDSLNNALVLIVRQSRANAWPQAKMILETLTDSAPFSAELQAYYFVVKPDREQFAKAMALIDLLGHTKALQMYVNGRVARNRWDFIRIGECFLKATKFEDSRKYCHVVHEFEERQSFGASLSINLNLFNSEEEADEDLSRVVRRALIPCRYLYGQLRYDLGERDFDSDSLAVRATDGGVDMCPLFCTSDYAELFPKIIGKDGRIEKGENL